MLRVVESETGSAASVVVPTELLASPIYANVRKTYARLAELVGHPPYTVAFGKKTRAAETFAQLREMALELAKDGIQVSRFKGLGEMDAEELAETTMNPANRMLVRVDVEDAAARGDQVVLHVHGRPGRTRAAFIEAERRERMGPWFPPRCLTS